MVAGQLIGHEQQKGQEEKVEQQPVPAPCQLSLCGSWRVVAVVFLGIRSQVVSVPSSN